MKNYPALRMYLIILLVFIIGALWAMPHGDIKPTILGRILATVEILTSNNPVFSHNLTPQTIIEQDLFAYDVNCTDADLADTITYYDNTSMFAIDSSTGQFSFTPVEADTGFKQILLTCGDGTVNTTGSLNLTITDLNFAPVLTAIAAQSATVGTIYTLTATATDADGDNLTFYDNTSLFIINSSGLINFTPTASQIGNQTILITVSDSALNDSESFNFSIVAASTSTSTGTGTTTGTTTGSTSVTTTGTTAAAKKKTGPCREQWSCLEWGTCSTDNSQTRSCTDRNYCGTQFVQPPEKRECTYVATCRDGIQNGDELAVDCGGPCDACPAIPETCNDGIKNQDEEDIDCGGPCTSCVIKRYAQIPFQEIPAALGKLSRTYPWTMLAVLLFIAALLSGGDFAYTRHARRKSFSEFALKVRQHRMMRKRLLMFGINIAFLWVLASLYVYYFSSQPDLILKNLPYAAAAVIALPIAAFAAIKKMEYHEYKKSRKEKRLGKLLSVQQKMLEHQEAMNLAELEKSACQRINELVQQNKFEPYPFLYKQVAGIYPLVAKLSKQRGIVLQATYLAADQQVLKLLLAEPGFVELEKTYDEFKELAELIAVLGASLSSMSLDQPAQQRYHEELLIIAMEDISADKHLMMAIASNPIHIAIYNTLVELYELIKANHQRLHESSKEAASAERQVIEKLQAWVNEKESIEPLEKDQALVYVYNALVDLHDHYKKRQDIVNEQKGLIT